MTIGVLSPDLLIASRIAAAAERAGHRWVRVDHPRDLPPPSGLGIVFVDWAARGPGWAAALTEWCAAAPESSRPRLVVFGPHTDLAAHAAARDAGLGPMMARSKLVAHLPTLLT